MCSGAATPAVSCIVAMRAIELGSKTFLMRSLDKVLRRTHLRLYDNRTRSAFCAMDVLSEGYAGLRRAEIGKFA